MNSNLAFYGHFFLCLMLNSGLVLACGTAVLWIDQPCNWSKPCNAPVQVSKKLPKGVCGFRAFIICMPPLPLAVLILLHVSAFVPAHSVLMYSSWT